MVLPLASGLRCSSRIIGRKTEDSAMTDEMMTGRREVLGMDFER
jgi:hypothetical protein